MNYMRQIIRFLIYLYSYLFFRNHDSKIIYYHDVGTQYTDMGTELDVIKKHIDIVRACGFNIVSDITERKGQIMVCFDDGWAGIYGVKDFFLHNHIFPTIFVAVDLIGTPGYLSIGQIRELQSLGFFFEGHSWSHKDLTTFDKGALVHEIVDSKVRISEILCKDVSAICFPQGRFSDEVVQCCKDAGYQKLYSSISGGYYDLIDDRSLICRNLVQDVSSKEFKYIINSKSPFFARRTEHLHYER